MWEILVTGGKGLVGSAFEKTDDIFLAGRQDGDLRDFSECKKLFEKVQPKYVIHLAAKVGGLYENMNHPVEMIQENLKINMNVLECAKDFGVTKLIAVLSTCIFPDSVEYPIKESDLHSGPPHTSNEGYAYAKRLLEVQCRAYNKQHSTNFMCVIPTNIYGSHDNFSLESSHVVPALIHKAFIAKRDCTPLTVLGSGKPLRQFLYSKDLAKILLQLLFEESSETIIISPDEEYSIADLAKLIAREFSIGEPVFDTLFSDGQYRKTVKNFRHFPMTPLDVGLTDTIKWFSDHYLSGEIRL